MGDPLHPDFLITTVGGPYLCQWDRKANSYRFRRAPNAREEDFDLVQCALPAIIDYVELSINKWEPQESGLLKELYIPPAYIPFDKEFQNLSFSHPSVATQKARGLFTTNGISHPFPLDQTFLLNTHPNSNHTIYLDFNGHTTSGTPWNDTFNDGNDFTTPPYHFEGDTTDNFTDTELVRIQRIWARVAEDYAPFGVNVTTQDPGVAKLRKQTGDTQWGVRVCIGGSSFDWRGGNFGGVAYTGSFTWSTDVPCYVFPAQLGGTGGNGANAEKYISDAISHEAGHTLGLAHHGRTGGVEYHNGSGSGDIGWAPLMGDSYTKNLSTWSNGDYPNANRTNQDDMGVISFQSNGFGYISATGSSTIGDATDFPAPQEGTSYISGVIRTRTDVNIFRFVHDGGACAIVATDHWLLGNIDIRLELLDSNGDVLVTANPASETTAAILYDEEVPLSAGTYYVRVSGSDNVNMSDYGSVGNFTIGLTQGAPPSPEPEWVLVSDTIDDEDRSYQDTGLAANTTYEYRVRAVYADGISGWSNIDNATTLDGEPPEEPDPSTIQFNLTPYTPPNAGDIDFNILTEGPWQDAGTVNVSGAGGDPANVELSPSEALLSVGDPSIGQAHAIVLSASEGSLSLGSASVGQMHLFATQEAEGSISLGSPNVLQDGELQLQPAEGTLSLGEPSVSQTQSIQTAPAEGILSLDPAPLSQIHSTTLLAAEGVLETGTPTVSQGHIFSFGNIEGQLSLGLPNISYASNPEAEVEPLPAEGILELQPSSIGHVYPITLTGQSAWGEVQLSWLVHS
jgi:hypothetical protein